MNLVVGEKKIAQLILVPKFILFIRSQKFRPEFRPRIATGAPSCSFWSTRITNGVGGDVEKKKDFQIHIVVEFITCAQFAHKFNAFYAFLMHFSSMHRLKHLENFPQQALALLQKFFCGNRQSVEHIVSAAFPINPPFPFTRLFTQKFRGQNFTLDGQQQLALEMRSKYDRSSYRIVYYFPRQQNFALEKRGGSANN